MVVSAASGAVGSVVGQVAKMMGCRAVGIAGGAAKCRYAVDELGLDACVDYKAGALAADLTFVRAGKKLVYATDLADTPENRRRLIALARAAHTLFCEATFREADIEQARRTAEKIDRIESEMMSSDTEGAPTVARQGSRPAGAGAANGGAGQLGNPAAAPLSAFGAPRGVPNPGQVKIGRAHV